MAIPPFPSQDLAKLVLGYLAEEQLMTAYDEFLQGSPYLDALRNEYDRILMTSLKHILAEYRAVKIYVETCKPFALRKKLLQCYNLLEIVKFLVQNVDINKLNEQEHSIEKFSCIKNRNVIPPNNPIQPSPQLTSQDEVSRLESSVKATSLDDLSGNATIKKKTVKVINTDAKNSLSNLNLDNERQACSMSPGSTSTSHLLDDGKHAIVNQQIGHPQNEEMIKCNKPESVQKIEEFNNILNYVCKNGSAEQNKPNHFINSVTNQSQSLSTAGTFQDFATGISNSRIVNVSNSDTSNVNKTQASLMTNVGNAYANIVSRTKEGLRCKGHLVLTVDSSKNAQETPVISTSSPTITQNNNLKLNARKREENKIKILSDVIVDKSYESLSGKHKMPPVLSNATSTPFQMPNILINGTPAYKNITQCVPNLKYTTDEIMAMPTIILVPASVSETTANSTGLQTVAVTTNPKPLTITSSSSQDLLKPLLIDVTSPTIDPPLSSSNVQNKQTVEQSLVKTAEATEHMSKPNDNTTNTFSTIPKTTTPQGLLPNRKSSSTPRRNTHVRVLDFTTPRRILTETINEQQSPEKNCSDNSEQSETVQAPCKEPKVHVENTVARDNVKSIVNAECPKLKTPVAKENKAIAKKAWDSDIRAAAVCVIGSPVKTSQKSRNKTKERVIKKKNTDEKTKKNANKEKACQKACKEKKKKDEANSKNKVVVDVNKSGQKIPVVVKPNINVISSSSKSIVEDKKIENDQKILEDKNKIKVDASTEQTETPESERVALQNVIGAKLNISDLLETPYKQVLYDIQMDTPKFLGSDLPDEPMSDVKIMSIPTPLFLRESNEKNATPSCYSSRPTDYSSGGSYYKPDDQDYIICMEVPESPLHEQENIKSNNDVKLSKQTEDDAKNKKDSKSSRPMRLCRKNVSYKNGISTSKVKEPLEGSDQSRAASVNSSVDNASDDRVNSRDTTAKEKRKQDVNKSKKPLKKTKSPIKRETPKAFMKIKPRRTTPTKEILGGKSRKISESSHHKYQKRTNCKDRSENLTPVATSIPIKSRRKSSTPRKLHCTKTFNLESSNHNSPETSKRKQDVTQDDRVQSRQSDGTQDEPLKDSQFKNSLSVNDSDDISKIKEYIKTCASDISDRTKDGEGSLHFDLIKRGFDVETAKIIERDLLDSPCSKRDSNVPTETECLEIKNDVYKSNVITSSGPSYSQKIIDDDEDNDDDDEEIELSVHECNEDTVNYVQYEYDDSSGKVSGQNAKLKDNYSMEICVDDGVTIRLRATTFSILLDQDPQEMEINYSYKETEIAVSSISNFEKLYTPLKDHKAQVYEIFDSTLTSLDTPLKVNSPYPLEHEHRENIPEIALEVEKMENNEKTVVKKRKRLQSGSSEESINCNKKTKRETQYLLNTTNIQNIDIESVLSKLHGP